MGVSEASDTTYVVLGLTDDEVTGQGRAYVWVGEHPAKSAEGAIRKATSNGVPQSLSGTYVAVPARSWKPMRVEQVQTVQTVITAADEPDPAKASNSKNAPEDEIRAVEAEAEES